MRLCYYSAISTFKLTSCKRVQDITVTFTHNTMRLNFCYIFCVHMTGHAAFPNSAETSSRICMTASNSGLSDGSSLVQS